MNKWFLLNPVIYWEYVRMRGITIFEIVFWSAVWTGVGIFIGHKYF